MAEPMTRSGYQKLQDEVRRLKNVERPRIVGAIAAAREFGDLAENAEYDAAKESQGIVEARISELEGKLSRAYVIDVDKVKSDTVQFGATVEVKDCESGAVSQFQVVSSDEADIKSGRLPITSPLAKALIGKKVGDDVEVSTPGGTKEYAVVGLKYVEHE